MKINNVIKYCSLISKIPYTIKIPKGHLFKSRLGDTKTSDTFLKINSVKCESQLCKKSKITKIPYAVENTKRNVANQMAKSRAQTRQTSGNKSPIPDFNYGNLEK